MRESAGVGHRPASGPLSSWWGGETSDRRSCLLVVFILSLIVCLMGALVIAIVGGRLVNTLATPREVEERA
ncbi:MAG: hypothetical protein PVI07_06220, partial [Anaerolineae bacterium]